MPTDQWVLLRGVLVSGKVEDLSRLSVGQHVVLAGEALKSAKSLVNALGSWSEVMKQCPGYWMGQVESVSSISGKELYPPFLGKKQRVEMAAAKAVASKADLQAMVGGGMGKKRKRDEVVQQQQQQQEPDPDNTPGNMINIRWLGALDEDERLCFEPRKIGIGPLDLLDLVDHSLVCYVEREPGQVTYLKAGRLHVRTVKKIEEAAFVDIQPVSVIHYPNLGFSIRSGFT